MHILAFNKISQTCSCFCGWHVNGGGMCTTALTVTNHMKCQQGTWCINNRIILMVQWQIFLAEQQHYFWVGENLRSIDKIIFLDWYIRLILFFLFCICKTHVQTMLCTSIFFSFMFRYWNVVVRFCLKIVGLTVLFKGHYNGVFY